MLRQRVFRRRVARRVLLLFVVSAIIPTLVVAALSLSTVTDHLDEMERDRLRRNAKGVGLAVLERLQFHASELYNLGMMGGSGLNVQRLGRTGSAFADSSRYRSIAVIEQKTSQVLMGKAPAVPLPDEIRDHLDQAGAAIITPTGEAGPRIIMLVRAPSRTGSNVVWAELNATPLFAAGSNKAGLPPDTDVCAFDAQRQPLYCSGKPIQVEALGSKAGARSGASNVSTWTEGDARQLTATWPLFLQSAFGTPSWTVALSEPAEVVLAPTRRFRLTFPLAIALAAAVVFLMSSVQIRRVLDPIQRLQEGTARLASGDFDEQVRIETGDEFSDLAGAFNDMASQIAWQLESLDARNKIVRAVLSKLEITGVVETVLERGPQVLGMGARILAPISAYHLAIPLVLHHHEKWNGTGYPHGLAGEKIPYLARVLAVADVWDAITSIRPYRKAFTRDAAVQLIRDGAGCHFDPRIVEAVLPYLEALASESDGAPDNVADDAHREFDTTPAVRS